MPPVDDNGYDDQQLVRYLLGLLSPEEAERLDEASIVDDEMADRLRGVEHDLVDAYTRGTLDPAMRKQFELRYLATERRRDAVAFAGRFANAVDRAALAQEPPRRPMLARVMPMVAAVAAILLVACGVLLVEMLRLERGLSSAEHERLELDRRARDLERQVADLNAWNAAASGELQRFRTAIADSPRTVSAVAPIAIVLPPQRRGVDAVPIISIRPGRGPVSFQLRLDSNEFQQYQAGLRDPAVNRIVWRSEWLAAITSGGQASVPVAVPAAMLRPQHYSFDLAARGPDRAADVIGSYAFEVAR